MKRLQTFRVFNHRNLIIFLMVLLILSFAAACYAGAGSIAPNAGRFSGQSSLVGTGDQSSFQTSVGRLLSMARWIMLSAGFVCLLLAGLKYMRADMHGGPESAQLLIKVAIGLFVVCTATAAGNYYLSTFM